MSQMLPEGGEVMRRVACGDVCPAPPAPAPAPALAAPPTHRTPSENKELLRQQLLSAAQREPAAAARGKPQRSRQKNRWKLKFHHQALPPEYLDHYEQTLQRDKLKEKQKEPEANNYTNETFKIWAQRLAGIQQETAVTQPNMASKPHKSEDKKKKPPAITPSKIVTYDDLPYMGEMTLNNSKPRRGRKPKKADICHLIYENYGTVVPGQPPPTGDDKLSQLSMCPPLRLADHPTPKTDLQNKIISSLLERKLSQESKRRQECTPASLSNPHSPRPPAPPTRAGPLHSDQEPLNLCIRDLTDLKLQIQKKFGNIYTSLPEVKTEPEEDAKTEQPNAISVIQRNTNRLAPSTACSSPDLSRKNTSISPALSEPAQSTVSSDSDKPPVYWPHAGLYMHPLALQTQLLYYQRLAAAGQLPFSMENQASATETSSSENSPNIDETKNKLVLKQMSELLDPKVIKQAEEKTPEQSKMKRASPNPSQGPVKRKRSAIFIPPVPPKSNSTTPTTEVSICKFKFTGGSKPTLQEKKMLSVDSGGNFRYYSGAGAGGKASNKGYEYMQRPPRADVTAPRPEPTASSDDVSKKKRKSRKSLQREKLEQTFKEKGFLIQTQQLQSAEGATYCKFRQLRKFTRYLFRSWKDYLPGELAQGGPAPAPAASHAGAAPVVEEWS
ncbi:uncharacterized protein LOC105383994 isoform X2 [Plutella xylostella]|uniref:uncharacterized protein LOC105383994 isoform X2 n=1 Tax=Plutella xylostella TaxID=51655 RepID=UPI002032D7B3|nr:uncharacterized protein LOC105383994 isoform X2 [Plutella xylostella]